MSEDSYPQPYPNRNGGSLTVVESQTLLSNLGTSGIIGYPADCALTLSGTGLQVTVAAGSALLLGTYYLAAAPNTLAVPANTSGSVRADRVVLRLTKATGLINAVVVTGTPGAGQPAILNDTQHFDWPIASYTVPSNGIPTGLLDQRRWLGGDCTASDSSDAPLYPRLGHRWYQIDTGNEITWNGSTWGQSAGVIGAWAEFTLPTVDQQFPGYGPSSGNNTFITGYNNTLTQTGISPSSTNPPVLGPSVTQISTLQASPGSFTSQVNGQTLVGPAAVTIPAGQGGRWLVAISSVGVVERTNYYYGLTLAVNGVPTEVTVQAGAPVGSANAALPISLNAGDVLTVQVSTNWCFYAYWTAASLSLSRIA